MYILKNESNKTVPTYFILNLLQNWLYIDISVTPMTATAPDYMTPATLVSFAQGAVVEELPITLQTDSAVEGIESFQIIISVMGTTAATGTVDASFTTANIFVLDLSCKFKTFTN